MKLKPGFLGFSNPCMPYDLWSSISLPLPICVCFYDRRFMALHSLYHLTIVSLSYHDGLHMLPNIRYIWNYLHCKLSVLYIYLRCFLILVIWFVCLYFFYIYSVCLLYSCWCIITLQYGLYLWLPRCSLSEGSCSGSSSLSSTARPFIMIHMCRNLHVWYVPPILI